MPWHDFRRRLLVQWRKRWIRVVTALLILSGATLLQYVLTQIPQPINVEASNPKYTSATAQVATQTILVEGGAMSSTDNNAFLSFDGKKNVTLNFHSDRAQLSADSHAFLSDLVRGYSAPPPTGFENVDYFRTDEESMSAKHEDAARPHNKDSNRKRTPEQAVESCRMYVRIYPVDNKLPPTIRFSLPESGALNFRAVDVNADDELVVVLKQTNPPSREGEDNPRGPGCGKLLQVGNWSLPNTGEFDLTFIVAPHATFRFDFYTTDSETALDSEATWFEPFQLNSLNARRVSVASISSQDAKSSVSTPELEVDSAVTGEPLNIKKIRSGTDELQLSYSGVAVVKVKGEPVQTLSFFDLVNRYPIFAGLFTLANAALLGWLIRSIGKTHSS